MRAVIEKVAAIGASIASVLFILAGAMLTYEVVARYFFTKPTRWAAELSQMCLIWGSLLAMAWLLKKRQHIQVDAVVRLLPGAVAHAIDRIVMLLVAVFSIVVCWYGFEIFYDSFSRGRTTGSLLNIPIWIVELAVPAGFALLALQALLETSRSSTEDSYAEGSSSDDSSSDDSSSDDSSSEHSTAEHTP